MARKNLDHIRVGNHQSGRYRLFCLHCGEHYDPALPISIDGFLALSGAFKKQHQDCKPGERVFTIEEIMEWPNSVSGQHQTRPHDPLPESTPAIE